VTTCSGKLKTSAVAAFLGDSALYRQKDTDCCAEVTFLALKTLFRRRIQADSGQLPRNPAVVPPACEKLPAAHL
jgi:hypothetical protein